MKRTRVATTLTHAELRALRKVMRYVRSMSGYKSRAEALRYLVRDWMNEDGDSLRRKTLEGVSLWDVMNLLDEKMRQK